MSKLKPVGTIETIDVGKVVVKSDFNPRGVFDEDEIESLGLSMDENSQLQAILVNNIGGELILVAGERRLRAAKAAGNVKISANVFIGLTDIQTVNMMLAENRDRVNLNKIEQAKAFHKLFVLGVKVGDIAASEHCSVDMVKNRLKLLDLSPEVQQIVAREHNPLPVHQALLLTKLGADDQLTVANKAAPTTGYVATEKQVKKMVNDILSPPLPDPEKPKKNKAVKLGPVMIKMEIVGDLSMTPDGIIIVDKSLIDIRSDLTFDKKLAATKVKAKQIKIELDDDDFVLVTDLIDLTVKHQARKEKAVKKKTQKKTAKKKKTQPKLSK